MTAHIKQEQIWHVKTCTVICLVPAAGFGTLAALALLPLYLRLGPRAFCSVSNNYQFVVSKAFLSTGLAVSRCMIVHCHHQVSRTAPRHKCACFFYGIYSFNSLGRHVISCISLLPQFGRCFEVRSLHVCACVCVPCTISESGGSFFSLEDS